MRLMTRVGGSSVRKFLYLVGVLGGCQSTSYLSNVILSYSLIHKVCKFLLWLACGL